MVAYRSFQEIRKDLFSGVITCERLVAGYLGKIAEKAHLNAFLEVYEEEALVRARQVDQKLAQGHAGSLAGMVVALKDLISFSDHRLEASSRMLKGYVSPFSATAVHRLLKEDAIVIGRTNCDEFGMGSSNEFSHFGPVLNSLDNRCVPGGSSGGSAVAVQAGLCTASLGTDTGGSVRQPASFCGVVGCKPTYSRISRYGLVAYASSFDSIGIMTNTVEDNALLLQVIAGHDPKDASSSSREVEAYSDLPGKADRLRIGWFAETLDTTPVEQGVEDNFRRTLDMLEASGHTVRELDFPLLSYVLPCYYILTTAEASSNLARYDGVRYGYRYVPASQGTAHVCRTRSAGFGAEVKRRILMGTYVLSADHKDRYYVRAMNLRSAIRKHTQRIFKEVDLVVSPTSPTTAFELGRFTDDPLSMYTSDQFTVHASLTGNPAISVPNGTGERGMPTGFQIMADHFREGMLYAFSDWYMHQKKHM